MAIPKVYVDEVCKLDGYQNLTVRVLANANDLEWKKWCAGNLGSLNCEECAKITQPRAIRGKRTKKQIPVVDDTKERVYCKNCQQKRQWFAESILTFFGNELLGEVMHTPDDVLRLFDRDDVFPSEIMWWIQLLPSSIRDRRVSIILGN